YNHAQYAYLFALGWASRTPLAAALWPAALRWRWGALAGAVVGWALLLIYFRSFAGSTPPDGLRVGQRVLWAAMSWWAILAACG
ncbi:hypothetical protein ABTK78_20425, partial [Acinetobacter baumannii]